MKMKLLGLILIFGAVLALGVHSSSKNTRQPQQNPGKSTQEEATPIQEGVMTEQQKQHSKLYERSGRRNLRNYGKSITVVITLPFVEADNEKPPSTIDKLLQSITCDADVVVVGTVTSKTSQLTEDGSFVFTDYEVQIQETVKNKLSAPIQPSLSITVTRPGGAVNLNGKILTVTDKSFQPLEVGKVYLLFLQKVSSTGAYRTVNNEGSFELNQNHVRRLTEKPLPYAFTYANDAASLVEQIRTIENLCINQSNGGSK